MRLSERLIKATFTYAEHPELGELLWEAVGIVQNAEQAKPIAKRHFLQIGAGVFAWGRWHDAEEDGPVFGQVVKTEYAYGKPAE